jgi:hypothetical protein
MCSQGCIELLPAILIFRHLKCQKQFFKEGTNVNPSKLLCHLFLLVAITVPVGAAKATDAETGLLAIEALGRLNGQALACSELQLAARAKSLMLAHAPKTQRFGTAYEEATQGAFQAQTRLHGTCPDATRLTDQLNRLALELSAALPVATPEPR